MHFAICSFFSKSFFFRKIKLSVDPDQAQHSVWPDLSPNSLQRISADSTGKQRISVGFLGSLF